MDFIRENLGNIASTGIALIALLVAIGTWLFPRPTQRRKIPEFDGEITDSNQHVFGKFISDNDGHIVKLRAFMFMNEEGNILIEGNDENENTVHSMSIDTNAVEGDCMATIELSIRPEKGSNYTPVHFANGGYHLNGFFVVRFYPGVHMGCVGASITEISAEQMALRG